MSATLSSAQTNKAAPGGMAQSLSMAAEYASKASDIADKAKTFVNTSGKGLTWLTAQNAFRLQSIFASAPVQNAVGNLRGMVISARWRHAYELSLSYSQQARKIGMVADFMAWASYIADWGAEIDRAVQSPDSWDVKAPRLCFYATTAAVKMLAGTAHGLTDLAIAGVAKTCQLGAAHGVSGSAQCASYTYLVSASVAVYYKNVEDATTPEAVQALVIDKGGYAIAKAEDWYDQGVSALRYHLK